MRDVTPRHHRNVLKLIIFHRALRIEALNIRLIPANNLLRIHDKTSRLPQCLSQWRCTETPWIPEVKAVWLHIRHTWPHSLFGYPANQCLAETAFSCTTLYFIQLMANYLWCLSRHHWLERGMLLPPLPCLLPVPSTRRTDHLPSQAGLDSRSWRAQRQDS